MKIKQFDFYPIIIISSQENTIVSNKTTKNSHTQHKCDNERITENSNEPVKKRNMTKHDIEPIEIQEKAIRMKLIMN